MPSPENEFDLEALLQDEDVLVQQPDDGGFETGEFVSSLLLVLEEDERENEKNKELDKFESLKQDPRGLALLRELNFDAAFVGRLINDMESYVSKLEKITKVFLYIESQLLNIKVETKKYIQYYDYFLKELKEAKSLDSSLEKINYQVQNFHRDIKKIYSDYNKNHPWFFSEQSNKFLKQLIVCLDKLENHFEKTQNAVKKGEIKFRNALMNHGDLASRILDGIESKELDESAGSKEANELRELKEWFQGNFDEFFPKEPTHTMAAFRF